MHASGLIHFVTFNSCSVVFSTKWCIVTFVYPISLFWLSSANKDLLLYIIIYFSICEQNITESIVMVKWKLFEVVIAYV